jgi:hypothetical protein
MRLYFGCTFSRLFRAPALVSTLSIFVSAVCLAHELTALADGGVTLVPEAIEETVSPVESSGPSAAPGDAGIVQQSLATAPSAPQFQTTVTSSRA